MSEKTCTKCGEFKPLAAFGKHKASAGGLRPVCRVCHCAINTKQRSERRAAMRPAKDAERQRIKQELMPVRRAAAAERVRRWKETNREQDRTNARRRWATSRERLLAYHREYRKGFEERNPGLMRHWVQQYRQLKIQAVPAWADLEAIKEVYEVAAAWNSIWGEDRVEVDHIAPLRGKNVCGLHVAQNLQIVRWQDNRAKGNRHV
jgi:hypothetical protein